MTLTHHVREKMQERLITPKDINKTLTEGKKKYKNNRIIYSYDIFIVVVTLDETTIVTAHYRSDITNTIRSIAERLNISFKEAATKYFRLFKTAI